MANGKVLAAKRSPLLKMNDTSTIDEIPAGPEQIDEDGISSHVLSAAAFGGNLSAKPHNLEVATRTEGTT